MKYRELGTSGIKASVVGLGTFAIGGWFWGGAQEEQSIAAIHASIDAGVNLIDTAPIYGFGLSEKVVGKAVQGKRDKVLIATKCGLVWDKEEGEFFTHASDLGPTDEPSSYKVYKNQRPEMIRTELENSLRRLNTDYVDLYQTHWQDATTPIEETMDALLKLKDEGKIRAIGVSNITVDHLKQYGSGIVSAQEKFSLLDRGIAENGIIDYCVENKLSILSYFTLEQGLLTGKLSPERSFDEGDMRKGDPKFTPENREKVQFLLKDFKPTAEKYNCTIPQLMIALTASQRGISHVLIGARNEKQAAENARGGYVDISTDDLQTLNERIGQFLKTWEA